MKIAVAALHLALLLTLGAWAEATEIPAPTTWLYTYTGSPFAVVTGVYQPGDRITGSFAIRSDFDVSNMGQISISGQASSATASPTATRRSRRTTRRRSPS